MWSARATRDRDAEAKLRKPGIGWCRWEGPDLPTVPGLGTEVKPQRMPGVGSESNASSKMRATPPRPAWRL
jgi:hypothetical protein